MKYARFAILLGVFVSTLIAGCVLAATQPPTGVPPAPTEPLVVPTEEPQAQWKVVLPKTNVGEKWRMAAFLDENFGITGGAGDVGKARYTSDGGKTWTVADSSGGWLYFLDIVDVKTIWQCGMKNVSMSTDGGKTWKAITGKAGGMGCILAFANAETGWHGSGAKFEMTTDGGATWKELALPKDVSKVAAISLRTPTDGYLVDANGVLHITRDGGQTWSSRSLGLDAPSILGFGSGPFINETPQAAVRFLDADHGLVVLGLSGKTGLIALRTADGGKTWKEESLPAELGTPYISRNGKLLTVNQWGKGLTLLKYEWANP